MEQKWKLAIEAKGFSYEQFAGEFFRFIMPALSPGEGSRRMDVRDFAAFGFQVTEPPAPKKRKGQEP